MVEGAALHGDGAMTRTAGPRLGTPSGAVNLGRKGSAESELLSQFVVKQHPQGDRYVVTARTECDHPLHSRPSSVADFAHMQRHHVAHQGDDAASHQHYYTRWREIATSKTEKNAETLLASGTYPTTPHSLLRTQPPPSSRGARSFVLSAPALAPLRQMAPRAPPKPLTLQDRKRRDLERQRRAWGIVDRGASINNRTSADDFLNTSAVSRDGRGSSALSSDTPHSSRSALSHVRARGGRSVSIVAGGKGSTSRRGTAEEARAALASLGIERPPTSSLNVTSSDATFISAATPRDLRELSSSPLMAIAPSLGSPPFSAVRSPAGTELRSSGESIGALSVWLPCGQGRAQDRSNLDGSGEAHSSPKVLAGDSGTRTRTGAAAALLPVVAASEGPGDAGWGASVTAYTGKSGAEISATPAGGLGGVAEKSREAGQRGGESGEWERELEELLEWTEELRMPDVVQL